MIEIKVEKNIVNLYKDGVGSPIYSIRKAELPLTRLDNGIHTSEWIEHLILKSWIEGNTLYELARLIENKFPDNKINWKETFFPVEKREYLNHVKQTKRLISDQKPEVNFKSLMENIQTVIDEQNAEVNKEISKIVEINLQKFNLNK